MSERFDGGTIRCLQRRSRLRGSTIHGGRWKDADLLSFVDKEALADYTIFHEKAAAPVLAKVVGLY